MTAWVTEKITADMTRLRKAGGNNTELGDLKGYVLQMESSTSRDGKEIKFIIVATDVSTKPVDDSVFVVDTDGYKMSTYKETMNMMKSMMGGK